MVALIKGLNSNTVLSTLNYVKLMFLIWSKAFAAAVVFLGGGNDYNTKNTAFQIQT